MDWNNTGALAGWADEQAATHMAACAAASLGPCQANLGGAGYGKIAGVRLRPDSRGWLLHSGADAPCLPQSVSPCPAPEVALLLGRGITRLVAPLARANGPLPDADGGGSGPRPPRHPKEIPTTPLHGSRKTVAKPGRPKGTAPVGGRRPVRAFSSGKSGRWIRTADFPHVASAWASRLGAHQYAT